MKGEELQELKLEELIELEELLEAGLCSVAEEKVCFIKLWLRQSSHYTTINMLSFLLVSGSETSRGDY